MEKRAYKTEFPPLLPEGFHSRTPQEIRELCVTAFPDSTVRADIMAGLQAILDRIQELDMECEIWLDGSFTTQKLEPEDVDFIVFAPMAVLATENPQVDEFIDWMNSNKDEPKKLFKCHTQVIIEEVETQFANDLIEETRAHYQELFGFSVVTHEPKGIVVLSLTVPDVDEEAEQALLQQALDVVFEADAEKGGGE